MNRINTKLVTLLPNNDTFSTLDTIDKDPTAADRKQDHIELAFQSQVMALDQRFYYEPMLAAHPAAGSLSPIPFLGKQLRVPIWVSSMTGGTEMALTINQNLARACAEFGLGMGLGSCRSLLYDNKRLSDFHMRPIIGKEQLLFGNLGLAQLQTLFQEACIHRIDRLMELLDLDGLIVHVNPLQEWLQPEGDYFIEPPIATIERLLAAYPTLPVIVKEVGQGFGPASLRALFQLPLAAIDTASGGGTNFAKLELLRSDTAKRAAYLPLAGVGHTALEMTNFVNDLLRSSSQPPACQQLIISGGIRNFLDAYYLTERVEIPAIYGMASAFLQHARGEYTALQAFVSGQIRGLEMAHTFLTIR